MTNQFDKWITERESDIFEVDKFNAMGKGEDYIFQALVFAGKGAQQLSIATTVMGGLSEVSEELKVELKSIQRQLDDFTEKLRNVKVRN